MKLYAFPVACFALLLACGNVEKNDDPVRSQVCPSGEVVDILGFNLGFAHPTGKGDGKGDAFVVQFVANVDVAKRNKEADNIFELVRPTCEAWGINSVKISAYPNANIRQDYIGYHFWREGNEKWQREELKGHFQK